MVTVVAPLFPMRLLAGHVIRKEQYGILYRNKGTPAQKIGVAGIQVMPPQSLHHPRRLENLPSPVRHRIGMQVHFHGISRMREKRSTHPVILFCPFAADRQEMVYQIRIDQILVQMVGRECHPKGLLRIIVQMIVSMPGRPDIPVTPIGENTGTSRSRTKRAIKEIKVTIPDFF